MSSMNQIGLATITQTLSALDKILDKLATHAEAKKIDEAVYLTARLAPDMFPFTRQIQIACDFAKGAAARLAGQEVPAWADEEKTIIDLKARIAKTAAFIKAIPAEALKGSDPENQARSQRAGNRYGRQGLSRRRRAAELLLPRHDGLCPAAA